MILLIAFAILGAALGAYMRPRAVAVVLAAVIAGCVRAGLQYLAGVMAGMAAPPPQLTMAYDAIVSPLAGYLPLIAVAAGAALFAALMCLILDERPSGGFWLPGQGDMRLRDRSGRFKRVADMVEQRNVQTAAEARLRAAHDG